jgi:hypothetical protein
MIWRVKIGLERGDVMTQRMTTIEVTPETAELLGAKATARNLSLDQYLHALASSEDSSSEAKPGLTPQERARRWDEWTTHHAIRTGTPVDDSRESIYTREDEAL